MLGSLDQAGAPAPDRSELGHRHFCPALAQQAVDDSADAAQEVSAREYELRLVRLMREQFPASGHGGDVVFVGPAELVRELGRPSSRTSSTR